MSRLRPAIATAGAAATLGGASAVLAAALGAAAAAPALAAVLFAGLALVAHPFLGVAAMAVFSHLDAVQNALFGFLPVSAFKLIAAATALAALLNARRSRDHMRRVFREPVLMAGLVFLLLSFASLTGAENKALSLAAIERFAGLGVLLASVLLLTDTCRKLTTLLWILVATSLVSALILIIDFSFGVQLVASSDAATTARTVEGVDRSAGGSDYNPTTAAALLLVGVVYALAHALECTERRWVLLTIVGVGTIAVILSYARSAALAYALIVAALMWRHRRGRYVPVALIGGVMALLAVAPMLPAEYWSRFSSLFGAAPDPTIGRRLSYNFIGVELFLQHPLFGVGPGNFFHHYTDTAYRFLPGRTWFGRELHNTYLSVLVQHGIVGAAPFFAMLVISLRHLRSVYVRPANDAMRVQAVALGYAFAAFLVTSFFLPNEDIKYTWLLSALSASLFILNDKARRNT